MKHSWVLILLGIFVLYIVMPVLYFSIGVLGGGLIKLLYGSVICNTINKIMMADVFQPEYIPIIVGIFSVIGKCFGGVTIKDK